MSAASTPKRRHDALEEEELPVDKRARRGPARDSDGPVLPDGFLTNGLPAPIEHHPGAIRRIKLKNFVTYSSVEFFPGPSLNMVIGPNGTGKSTLVCAICIGLGYDPKHLGRAKDLAEFVKHGFSQAYIEVEVQRPPSRAKHPVFKCTIKRDTNKVHYSIDDKPFSTKEIKKRAGKLGVQIDNLCQFLPQDRVVEFANMSPVELLRRTQEAIASREMQDWHETLKSTRKDQRLLEGKKADYVEALAGLENKQRLEEADVRRIRERKEVQAKVSLLEKARPLVRYRALKGTANQKKEESAALTRELQQLEASMEPFMRKQKAKNQYRRTIEAAVRQHNAEAERKVAAVEDQGKEYGEIERKAQAVDLKRASEKQAVKNAETDSHRITNILRSLRNQEAQPVPASQAEINAKSDEIRRCEREVRTIQESREEDREKYRELSAQKNTRTAQISRIERQMDDLRSKSGQQLQKLKNLNLDAFKAYEWVRDNQDKFEKQVFGPPLVECSIKDPRMADMVESTLSRTDLQTFTTQTSGDFRILQQALRQKNISKVNQRTVELPLASYRAKVNSDQLQRFGLDGWIVDLVDGPGPVLASLCEGSKVHQNAYYLRELSDTQFEDLKASTLGRVVTTKSSFTFTRRHEYGPDATSVRTSNVEKARFWTDAPVDTSALSFHRQKISELKDEIEGLEGEMHRLGREKNEEHKTRITQLEDEIKSLRVTKDEWLRQLTSYQALPTRIQTQEAQLADCTRKIDNYRSRDRELVRAGDELAFQQAQLSLAYADAVEELQTAHENLQNVQIMLIEAVSDCEVLEERNASMTQQLETKRVQRTEVDRIAQQARAEAETALLEINRLVQEAGDEFREQIRELQTKFKTSEQLETEIESEKARLELMSGDSHANTLAQYERRASQIAGIKAELEKYESSLSEMAGIIAELRGKWEPELDKLVSLISHSFSYNMRQINCAGEVSVHKDDDDFDQWAIKVMVKFRESEALSQLDAHRQSGGERAVSTSFYLMSLQSLTRSPFRVVDEINQGMDPRNERLVHARMVAIATGTDDMPPPVLRIPKPRRERVINENGEAVDVEEGDDDDDYDEEEEVDAEEVEELTRFKGSQYFLITPKLLPDLKYERGMRVLCIASGEHMPPAESNAVDFRKQLDLRRGRMATAAG